MIYLKVDGVEVVTDIPDLTTEEARRYIDYCEKHSDCDKKFYNVASIAVNSCDDGKVDVEYTMRGKFERIRRITG